MQVKKQQLKLDIEQWTGSKLAEEYMKAVYWHPASLTYMQNISSKILGKMLKRKLESRFAGININNLSYADETTLRAESKEELESLLIKVKEESKKPGLKLIIPKTKIMDPVQLLHGK